MLRGPEAFVHTSADHPRHQLPVALPVLVLALAGGVAMALAFPRPGWHGLMIPGVMAVLSAARLAPGRGVMIGAGLLSGYGFYLPLLWWSTLFLGPLPWFALGTAMTLWWLVGFVAIAAAYRWARRAWWGATWEPWARWLIVPVVVASLWIARELGSGTMPYGGFAWGRVAQTLADSPLIELVSWLGLTGTGWVMVLVGGWAVEALMVLVRRRTEVRPWARGLPTAGVLGIVVVLMAVPGYHVPTHGTIRMAGIQGGDERAGYFRGGSFGDIYQAHVRATSLLDPAEDVDLIVWPEGATEWDPTTNGTVRAYLDHLVQTYDAPVYVGAPVREGEDIYQSQVLFDGAQAPAAIYHKRNPVPFGEYVPHRDFYARIVPGLIGLIGRDYTPGTVSPTVPVESATAGAAPVGTFICYDVIDDGLAREAVRDGAQWMLTPSNNADFGRTDELDQQIAFAKLRAVESGRTMVQVSTVGFTAAFAPDGTTLAAQDWYTPAAMVVDVPLASALTPAVKFGPVWTGATVVVGLGGLGWIAIAAGVRPRWRRRVR